MRNDRMVAGMILLLLAACGRSARASHMVFPGAAWEEATPESQNVDPARLKAAVDYLAEHAGSDGVKRLVIVRNGRLIWKGPQADRPQRVWSVTKAFTSAAHGLLIEDGKCTLDTLAKDYNAKDLVEHYPGVTLRHFATMTSGYDGVYGYHWWPNGVLPSGQRRWPDAPACTYIRSGHNNNCVFVVPAWSMVIARLGLDGGEDPITTAEQNEFLEKVGEAILDPVVEGERRVWYPVTVSFRGPTAREMDQSPNPFLDYRLAVTFRGPDGRRYDVPGFFDGDGHGGDTGSVWRVRFTPDAAGRWSFMASFRKGDRVAVSLDPGAGEPVAPDGQAGEFDVEGRDPNASGFLGAGRLAYAPGKFYLKTLGDNRYWIKGGTDSPEDLLAYEGFDNTRSGSRFAVKTYAAHVRDWQPGDPDWGSGRGRGIIGAINYLAGQHVNLIYFLPMNIGGDGQNVWPFAGEIRPAGDPNNDNTHYDLSKLRQWEIVFHHAQTRGIVLHFVLNEAERQNKLELGGRDLTTERKLFYREMAARFGHHNGLIWNLCEEYNIGGLDLGAESVRRFAAYLRAVDPHGHPITVHHAKDPVESWRPFLGDKLFGITSLQIGRGDIEPVVEMFRRLTREAGRPLPVAVDEFTVSTSDQPWIPVDDAVAMRKEKLWPAYLSGGQVELILADLLDAQDFRKYEDTWQYLWHARRFLEEHLPFWDMEPADDLLTGESVYAGKTCSHDGQVFAKEGECYAIYLPIATETGVLDLSRARGEFVKRWYNPRSGSFEGTGKRLAGGGKVEIGPPPGPSDEDWVVLVESVNTSDMRS